MDTAKAKDQPKTRRARISVDVSDATQPQHDFAFDSMLRAQERPLGESTRDAQAIEKVMSRPVPKKRPLPPPLPFK